MRARGILRLPCFFQFDNFKRVFKVVEELKGPLVENIRQNFILSDKLARYCLFIVSTHREWVLRRFNADH